jgi:signal transduction histidine kinase
MQNTIIIRNHIGSGLQTLIHNRAQLSRSSSSTQTNTSRRYYAEGARDEVNLRWLVDQAYHLVSDRAAHKMVVLKNQIRDIELVASRTRLLQVFCQLLTNAIEHSAHGGLITVSAMVINNELEILVADEGAGLPGGVLAGLFQQVRHAARLSSDGDYEARLAACSKAVAHHGGSMGVRHESGRGTTQWFALPLHCAPEVSH